MHDTLCSVILYILAGEHSQSLVQSTVLTFLAKEFQKAEDVFVWINMDDEDLPEDKKARFPVHLAKLTQLDTAKGSIGFNWYARSHNMSTGSQGSLEAMRASRSATLVNVLKTSLGARQIGLLRTPFQSGLS